MQKSFDDDINLGVYCDDDADDVPVNVPFSIVAAFQHHYLIRNDANSQEKTKDA
jgi:hypothetical protein